MAFEDKKQATRIRRKKTCWFTETYPPQEDLLVHGKQHQVH